jgi:iron-sulfur cluster assembly protein
MITVTEIAANKISANLAKRGKGIGIQIGVRTTGCSGMAYVLEYIDFPPMTRDWFKYESGGAMVYVNGKDLVYMTGMEIDYVRQGLNEGFEFRNPNERDRCGCGESFRV